MRTPQQAPKVVIVMGVAGCGKSTIGAALAKTLECPFIEGDARVDSRNLVFKRAAHKAVAILIMQRG